MSNPIRDDMTGDQIAGRVEETLDVVARSLREAADQTQDLSEEAGEALALAAADVVRVAEKLRQHAVDAAVHMARQASHEVQQHPIAALAAALGAVAALAGIIAAARSGKAPAA